MRNVLNIESAIPLLSSFGCEFPPFAIELQSMRVLVTGAKGFLGRNLSAHLMENGHEVLSYDRENSPEDLKSYLAQADFIVHLAGINRPLKEEEFLDGNVNFTKTLLDLLKESGRRIPLFFSSSTQAEKDNPYGHSKKLAEDQIFSFAEESGNPVYVYRLYNVYGKWCRPNYNSVIATWCHSIARGEPITINEAAPAIDFVYIDDVCNEILSLIEGRKSPDSKLIHRPEPHDTVSLKEIARLLRSFRESRVNASVPEIDTPFKKKLYSTYLSYLPEGEFSYGLKGHVDSRGSFTEILKKEGFGQISVNVIKPGITKGNHYHHTKNEKFLVLRGECLTEFRRIDSDDVISYRTRGDRPEVIDIPPGYTHSIANTGKEDAIVLMWANEPFDPENPDTHRLNVEEEKQ